MYVISEGDSCSFHVGVTHRNVHTPIHTGDLVLALRGISTTSGSGSFVTILIKGESVSL